MQHQLNEITQLLIKNANLTPTHNIIPEDEQAKYQVALFNNKLKIQTMISDVLTVINNNLDLELEEKVSMIQALSNTIGDIK
jgi:hypothetical protein